MAIICVVKATNFAFFGGSDENSLQTRLIKTLNLLDAFRDSISSSVIN